MELEVEEKQRVISRTPNKFRFKVIGDVKSRERSNLIVFADVKSEEIEWLWAPYVPLGRLTMLGGDPGTGKSFITTALAAALSRGDPLPGEEEAGVSREPAAVLMLSAEDDPGDTIKPRLTNLHADQTRIFVSTDDIILDNEGLNAVRAMLRETKARLLIIDPIVAFLGPKVDMNRANEVRHIMRGLSKIAREFNIAVIIVRHNRKQRTEEKAIYAGAGSIDFTASVRSEMAVVVAKNGMHFLNHIKSNSGKQGNSITYEIINLPDGSGLFKWGSFAAWPMSGARTETIVATRFKNEEQIKLWLHDNLKNHPNGDLAKNILAKGQLAGYSQTKLEHIKKGIALSIKVGHEWYWKLDPAAATGIAVEDRV